MDSGPRSLIPLNIGGQRFDVLRSTLLRWPDTLLGRIAKSASPVYIDRSPLLFVHIVNAFRTGKPFNASHPDIHALYDEALFYQIERFMFPNGIESTTAGFGMKEGEFGEDKFEGQCSQFELHERCVLVPGMSATFSPRSNETLILDTIAGKGILPIIFGFGVNFS
jgi:hypothetical protein